MKIHFSVLFLIIWCFGSVAQNAIISTQDVIGGSRPEYAKSALYLSNGEIIIASNSASGISGDKTQDSYGGQDYWVFKLNGAKQIIWQITIGGAKDDVVTSIIEAKDGGYLVVGSSLSGSTGNKTTTHHGGWDSWIIKLSKNGQLEWQKSFGGISDDFGTGILMVTDSTYAILNTSDSDSTGNKWVRSKGGSDYWVIFIDEFGNEINQLAYGGNGDDLLNDAKIWNNSLIFLGSSRSYVSGDKKENPIGGYDYWLVKTDLNGTLLETYTLGGNNDDIGIGINAIDFNEMIVYGNSRSNTFGKSDYQIVSIGADFSINWESNFGGKDDEFSRLNGCIYVPEMRKHLIMGVSFSGYSGNKYLNMFDNQNGDIWIVSVDEFGNKTFEFEGGGSGSEGVGELLFSPNKTVMVIGSSASNVSGNKDKPNKGGSDVWYFELDFNLSVKTAINNSELNTYPNPVQTVLNFSLPMTVSNSEISLTDITGKVVYTDKLGNVNQSKIDVSGFPKGMYVLSVISSEFQYTRKVLID
ncbi:MAG: T9SS type A sorting domain-containing protein [Salibacteraceae bacterium]